MMNMSRKLAKARAKVVAQSAVGALRPKILNKLDDRINTNTIKNQGAI
jgi:pilus assembly protein TadC